MARAARVVVLHVDVNLVFLRLGSLSCACAQNCRKPHAVALRECSKWNGMFRTCCRICDNASARGCFVKRSL